MRTFTMILYAAIGFLTFGVVFNDRPCGEVTRTYTDAVGGKQVFVETRSCVSPIASGALWPAYWLGVAAIAITKPESPAAEPVFGMLLFDGNPPSPAE